MNTIRQSCGLSGFPKREESVYDAFGAGHSSTSISAALGNTIFTYHGYYAKFDHRYFYMLLIWNSMCNLFFVVVPTYDSGLSTLINFLPFI